MQGIFIPGNPAYSATFAAMYANKSPVYDYKFEVMWDATSPMLMDGTWFDESANVLDISTNIFLGPTDDYGNPIGLADPSGSSPSRGMATLNNVYEPSNGWSGRYTSTNTHSSIHAYIKDGGMQRKPCRVWLGYNTANGQEVVPIFQGILEIPQSSMSQTQLSIPLAGREKLLLEARASTNVSIPSIRADRAMAILLRDAGFRDWVDGGQPLIDYDFVSQDAVLARPITFLGTAMTVVIGTDVVHTNYPGYPSYAPILSPNDVFQIDEEQMLVVSISVKDVTVKRGWNGTPVTVHDPYSMLHFAPTLDIGRIIAWTIADQEYVWQQLHDIAQADGGLIYIDSATGLVNYRSLDWLLTCKSTSVLTITDNESEEVVEKSNPRSSSFNRVIIERTGYSYTGETEMWRLAQSDVSEILPGQTITLPEVKLQYPMTALFAPEPAKDYLFRGSGGSDLTYSVTVTIVLQKCMRTQLSITNNNPNQSAYPTFLHVRGTGLQTRPAQQDIYNIPGYIGIGNSPKEIKNPWIQSSTRRLGKFLSSRYGHSTLEYQATLIAGNPALERGDRITVVLPQLGESPSLSFDCYIMNMSWKLTGGNSPDAMLDMDLLACSSAFAFTNPFIIGSSALNSTKVLDY